MAPKAPEKSPQQQQPPPLSVLQSNAVVIKHSNPFHISAHTLCHNRRLKQKRSKYAEYVKNAPSRHAAAVANKSKKTEIRRQNLSLLQAEFTIDLLSDDEQTQQQTEEQRAYAGRMCLERAAILGLMPVEHLTTNGPPPLVPLSINKGRKSAPQQRQLHVQQKQQMQLPQQQQKQPQQLPQQRQHMQLLPQQKQQQPQQLPVPAHQQQPRKRKSRPQKRRSLPAPTLLNNESIVLSDDSDNEQQNHLMVVEHSSPAIPLRPDLSIIYPNPLQNSHYQTPTLQATTALMQPNTMQVDEEVTISLVPRSLSAATCARSRSSVGGASISTINHTSPQQPPPFPMLPDETTVHTVIANRIYELSLTKLREGLATTMPEFNGGQQKISPPRRKGAVKAPPIVTQPQAPISLKLSSDLSISLISDDEDDTRHYNKPEALLSPAFLQKLPVNVSIAPVPITPQSNSIALDPRKLKFG